MSKTIHIILSRESWEELKKMKEEFDFDYITPKIPTYHDPQTYEEYLDNEKKNPTHCLFG